MNIFNLFEIILFILFFYFNLKVVYAIFLLEAIFKIIAYGRLYFLDPVSWFDLLVILLSTVDFVVPNVNGLTVFRAFRLVINKFKKFIFIQTE